MRIVLLVLCYLCWGAGSYAQGFASALVRNAQTQDKQEQHLNKASRPTSAGESAVADESAAGQSDLGAADSELSKKNDILKGRRHPVISTPRASLNDYTQTVRFAGLSSPRKTWESFLMLMDEYGQEIEANGYTYDNRHDLKYLESQIVNLFDLRGVSSSLRKDVGLRAAVYLREAIARYDLPEADVLPTRSQAFLQIRDGYPGVWTVYESPIEIVYIDSGAFDGRFQFSHQTALNARQIWNSVRQRSFVYPEFDGLVDAYLNTPGPGIPDELIDSLPAVFRKDVGGVRLWQLVIVVATGLLGVLLVIGFAIAVNKSTRSLPRVLRSLLSLLVPLAIICLGVSLDYFYEEHVFLTGNVLSLIYYAKEVVLLLCSIVIVFIIGNILAELILLATRLEYQRIDTYLIRFGLRLASIIIAIVLLIEGFQHMGFTLATVITGAGVTGLAIALAAQESLRNLFGSVMLLLDKPFRVGQRIKMREYEGVVEEIGLRSTKLRLRSGNLVTLPNESVARTDIENVSMRAYIRRNIELALALDTPPARLQEAIAILYDILAVRPGNDSEGEIIADPEKEGQPLRINEQINHPDHPPRVLFSHFSPTSINITVTYWHYTSSNQVFRAYASQINTWIIERFHAAGIVLARPSQTLYFGKDVCADASDQFIVGQKTLSGTDNDTPQKPDSFEST